MTLYIWDELSCEIAEGPAQAPEGWEFKLEYPNGVRRYHSDRHIALECEAASVTEANEKFAKFCEIYVEMMRGRDVEWEEMRHAIKQEPTDSGAPLFQMDLVEKLAELKIEVQEDQLNSLSAWLWNKIEKAYTYGYASGEADASMGEHTKEEGQ